MLGRLPEEIYGGVVEFTGTLSRLSLRKTSKAIREATDPIGIGMIVHRGAKDVDLVSVFVESKTMFRLAVSGSVAAVMARPSSVVMLYDVATSAEISILRT